jgi:hypothetical protein
VEQWSALADLKWYDVLGGLGSGLILQVAIREVWSKWKSDLRVRPLVHHEQEHRILERRLNRLEALHPQLKQEVKLMFPLQKRIISGYKFGQKTWYGSKHLGVDYKASGDTLYAPSDGIILDEHYGSDGGNTILFKPDNDVVAMRFMHLSKYLRGKGPVKRGEPIAITGNTGLFTTGPHLHLDITRNWSGQFWRDFNNFIDPELFNWEAIGTAVTVPVVNVTYKTVKTIAPAHVRKEPRLKDDNGNDIPIVDKYPADYEFQVLGKETGGKVGQHTNNIWYKECDPNRYVWSGNLREVN